MQQIEDGELKMTQEEKLSFYKLVTEKKELYGPPVGFGNSTAKFSLSELREAWRNSDVATVDKPSMALYIHIPFCLQQRCSFCMYKSLVNYDDGQLKNYSERIGREISFWNDELMVRPLSGLYVGGGTPNIYKPELFASMLQCVKNYTYESVAEKTCELAACSASIEHVYAVQALSFNRISLGVQSFDREILSAVNREYASPDKVHSLISPSREGAFLDVNIDLMLGLPHRTSENIRFDVRAAIECGALSISLYTYRNVNSSLSKEDEENRQRAIALQLEAVYEVIDNAGWERVAGNTNTEYHLFFSPKRTRGTFRFRTGISGLENHRVLGVGSFAHGFSPSLFYTCERLYTLFSENEHGYSIGILNKRQQMQMAICNMLYGNEMKIDTVKFLRLFGCAFEDVFEEEILELGKLGKILPVENGYYIPSTSRFEAAALQKFFWDFSFLSQLIK